MIYVAKVCGILPGEVNLKVAKLKEKVRRDGVDGDKVEESRLMSIVIIVCGGQKV